MTTTDNPIESIAERINKKAASLGNDQKKIGSLDEQIELYERSKAKLNLSIAEKQSEIDTMVGLQKEAATLVRERDALSDQMQELVDHYNSFEWRPDQPEEEKLESSNFNELRDQKYAIQDRINEIVKSANKIYYRR